MSAAVTSTLGLAVLALGSWLVPALMLLVLAPLLRRRTVRNYRGRAVYLGLGWAWVAWSVAVLLLRRVPGFEPAAELAVAGPIVPVARIAPVGLVLGVFALGWLDDRFGDGRARGLRGHIAALARGRLTTGLLKLVGIGVLAVVYGYLAGPVRAVDFAPDPVRWPFAAIVIAGAANLVNLTDLRPGRALKTYGVLACLGAASAAVYPPTVPLLGMLVLLLGPVLAVWPYDLGERGMLGDAGANAAGALAGYVLAAGLPLPGLVAVAALLVALNLASERVSFSAVIERNPVLRALDDLGRLPEEPTENLSSESS